MKAHIVKRQSPDWGNLDYSYLRTLGPFEKMAMLPEGFISNMITTWDKIFPTTYFDLRQRLKEISAENLKTIKHSSIVDLEVFRQRGNPQDICFFIDDDDFFHPDIVSCLETHLEENDGLIWCSALYKGDIELREDFHCYTNNYAVSGAYLSANFAERLRSVEQHFWANRVFKSDESTVAYIPHPLSVANKHPCSPSWFWNRYGPDFTEHDLRSYVFEFTKTAARLDLHEELSWASGYLEDVRACFSDLV